MAPILAEFLNNLGGTSWMNINNGYYDRSGNAGTSAVSHGGTCFDPYSHGKKLTDDDVLVGSDPPCSVNLTKAPGGNTAYEQNPTCQILLMRSTDRAYTC